MSFFSELQRRNVWRVALLYVVASWIILQVADVLVPALALPESTLRLVALLLILGFPLALLFSWIYELTPEGLKRERDVDRDASIVDTTGRKINVMIIVLLVVAIAGLAYDRLVPKPTDGSNESTVIIESRGGSEMPVASAQFGEPQDLTIAVLPFELRTADSDIGIFAFAIADQLRVLLSSDKRLKVTGSISSDSASERQLDIVGIREQLGVGHVIRGNATVVGDTLQVRTELIATHDGFTVWSNSYERTADELYGMPEEIARAVVRTMTNDDIDSELAQGNDVGDMNPEAYKAYLLGSYFIDRDGSQEDYERAAAELERVVELEPNYAIGWSRLARARLGIGARNADVENIFQKSRIAAERAIALDPELSEAWSVLGGIKLTTGNDFAGAYVAVKRARNLNPNTEYATRLAGILEAAFGRIDGAANLSLQAAAIDPLSTKTLRNAALYAMYAGDNESAIEHGTRALEINEGAVVVPYIIARAHAARGEIVTAKDINAKEPIIPFRDFGEAYIYLADEDHERAAEQISYLIEQYADIAAVNLAELKAITGDYDAAFTWLDAAIENKDTGLYDARSMPGLRPLYDDPRWQPFVVKAGLETPP